jgi:hypothetical protein
VRGADSKATRKCYLGGVGSPWDLNGNGVASNPLAWVFLAIILEDHDWFKILGIGFLSDVGGEGGEAVVIVVVVVPVGAVPSSCLDDAPRVAAIIDLLPKIDRGSIVKAGLRWSFTLRPCVAPVSRWVSGLLYLLLNVATRRLLALVALAIVVPPVPEASSRDAANLHSVTMAFRPRGHVSSGRNWMLPIELHERARLNTAAFVYGGWVVIVELGALLLQWRQSVCDTPDPQLLQKHC